MAIDLSPLWDFSQPALSEQRFRQALARAAGDDALILQTQIARSYGLRKNFDEARVVLRQIEPLVESAGFETRARYLLELGRTYASAAHTPEQLTPDATARARRAYESALELAREARLDDLAIDALHMFAFLETSPAEQLGWAEAALEIVLASSQPEAKRWEPAVRNNLGYALHRLGRYDDALREFEQALKLREDGANGEATRVARWMVAWTLRSLNRIDDALAIQLRLERESAAAGTPDPHVFEELEALYRTQGDAGRAEHYAKLKGAARKHGGG